MDCCWKKIRGGDEVSKVSSLFGQWPETILWSVLQGDRKSVV